MGNFRPAKVKCIEALLRHLGYRFIRTEGSHDIWTKLGKRSIPIWGAKKEIPAFHVKTISKNTLWSMEEIYNWMDENC